MEYQSTLAEFLTAEPENGRGCGKRDEGDAYACVATGAVGLPAEAFIRDPAIPLKWRRSPFLQQRPKERLKLGDPEDLYDLVVCIGRDPGKGGVGYPSAWSWFWESKTFGPSRKIPENVLKSDNFKKLVPGKSMLRVAHPHAIPDFGYECNWDKPDHFCKRMNWWAASEENREIWRKNGFGWHPGIVSAKTSTIDFATSRCSYALRDLACLDHINKDIVLASQSLGFHDEAAWFEVEMPSFNFRGKYPKVIRLPIQWKCGIFVEYRLTHFEIPVSDKKDRMRYINQADFQGFITEN